MQVRRRTYKSVWGYLNGQPIPDRAHVKAGSNVWEYFELQTEELVDEDLPLPKRVQDPRGAIPHTPLPARDQ
jgi:hypothetical protein